MPQVGSSGATLPSALQLAQSGKLVEPQPMDRVLGERAFGCGRWCSGLTESFQSDVRSLTRAPLARSRTLCEPRELRAGGVSQGRCNRVRVRCTVDTLEPARLVHRSFDPPPALCSKERGRLLSKPKASNVNGSKNPLAHCFGRAKQPPERPLLLSAREVSPRTNLPADETVSQEDREVPFRHPLDNPARVKLTRG